MKLYALMATMLATASMLQAQTVDIDIYNTTGYKLRLERNYLPGTPQPAPMLIDEKRDLYHPVYLRNQDLDRLKNYAVYYVGYTTPALTINADELSQRAAQFGAHELIITLEPDAGYITTGIRARITARGKAQPQQGATQPVAEGSELGEFEFLS